MKNFEYIVFIKNGLFKCLIKKGSDNTYKFIELRKCCNSTLYPLSLMTYFNSLEKTDPFAVWSTKKQDKSLGMSYRIRDLCFDYYIKSFRTKIHDSI